jgi:hypothetical protein
MSAGSESSAGLGDVQQPEAPSVGSGSGRQSFSEPETSHLPLAADAIAAQTAAGVELADVAFELRDGVTALDDLPTAAAHAIRSTFPDDPRTSNDSPLTPSFFAANQNKNYPIWHVGHPNNFALLLPTFSARPTAPSEAAGQGDGDSPRSPHTSDFSEGGTELPLRPRPKKTPFQLPPSMRWPGWSRTTDEQVKQCFEREEAAKKAFLAQCRQQRAHHHGDHPMAASAAPRAEDADAAPEQQDNSTVLAAHWIPDAVPIIDDQDGDDNDEQKSSTPSSTILSLSAEPAFLQLPTFAAGPTAAPIVDHFNRDSDSSSGLPPSLHTSDFSVGGTEQPPRPRPRRLGPWPADEQPWDGWNFLMKDKAGFEREEAEKAAFLARVAQRQAQYDHVLPASAAPAAAADDDAAAAVDE